MAILQNIISCAIYNMYNKLNTKIYFLKFNFFFYYTVPIYYNLCLFYEKILKLKIQNPKS